jgi:hypothetical protein
VSSLKKIVFIWVVVAVVVVVVVSQKTREKKLPTAVAATALMTNIL